MNRLILLRWVCGMSLGVIGAPAQQRLDEGFAPVAVSAANYRALSKVELRAAINGSPRLALEGDMPALQGGEPERAAVYFIFAPGEGDEEAMPYDEMCEMLTPALARRGFINAANAAGQVTVPLDRVALVLKVSYGTIPWRMPVVRTERLLWRDGLRPRSRNRLGRSGGDVAFDYRYGGTRELGGNLTGPSGGPRLSQSLAEFGETKDTHLIVVDAFSYAELQEKGMKASRVWSTFVSAPRRRGGAFVELAPALVEKASAYFGGTSVGMQVYPDVETDVNIGEVEVVTDERDGS